MEHSPTDLEVEVEAEVKVFGPPFVSDHLCHISILNFKIIINSRIINIHIQLINMIY